MDEFFKTLSTQLPIKTIDVVTNPCPRCGKRSTLTVSSTGYKSWIAGELIQRAFPTLSADTRESLQTGYHGACFYADFGGRE